MRSQPQLGLLTGQQTSPLHTPAVPLLCVQLCPSRDVKMQLAFAPHTAVWHWLLLPHWVPMGSGGNVQPLGLQVLAVQELKSSQPAWRGTQLPARQRSPLLQGLPSLHRLSSGRCGSLQTPVAGAQTPTVWHWLLATQVTGAVRPQLPA